MKSTDAAFKNLAIVFLKTIQAREPPGATDAERLVLDFLVKEYAD